jgi:3-dehydroquinate dehydratase-2
MASPKATARPAVLVIHGPNLNLLGQREPDVYGHMTLAQLDASLRELGDRLGLQVDTVQGNGEGALIDFLHASAQTHAAVVINPAGYTHTSVALADALRSLELPIIEVHLSNLYTREPFRHTSRTGAACQGVIMGFGAQSYALALRQLAHRLLDSPLPS